MMTGANSSTDRWRVQHARRTAALHEREEIGRALMADPMASWAAVARRVGRHPSTIARESRGVVVAVTDQRRGSGAPSGRRGRRARRLLAVRGALRERIATELRLERSPVAIWSDLVAEDAPGRPCVESIYQAIYDGALGVRRVSVCAAAAAGGDRDNAAGQRGARRRRTSSGDQTRSTTAARAGTGKATRSSAPTTARR